MDNIKNGYGRAYAKASFDQLSHTNAKNIVKCNDNKNQINNLCK
ncbi:hypothetical protein SA21262_1764 [Staphylococcus aureus subsp. aureus 21262]|nr:hypothetical protein SA21262_1764 [Staphylococcus aureus subsp. aureus 21262]